MARQRVPLTARTAVQRINRVLAARGLKLVKTKEEYPVSVAYPPILNVERTLEARQDFYRKPGAYSMVDNSGTVVQENLNLDECCRAEEVLKPHEYIIDVAPDKDNILAELEKLLVKNERQKQTIERYKKKGYQFPDGW